MRRLAAVTKTPGRLTGRDRDSAHPWQIARGANEEVGYGLAELAGANPGDEGLPLTGVEAQLRAVRIFGVL